MACRGGRLDGGSPPLSVQVVMVLCFSIHVPVVGFFDLFCSDATEISWSILILLQFPYHDYYYYCISLNIRQSPIFATRKSEKKLFVDKIEYVIYF
jgi:hypothetical protein